MDDGRGADRAGGTQRMAQGDRATQRVHLRRIQSAGADHRQRLRSEGLVEFDPVELVLVETSLLERLRDRRDRADAHDFRTHAGDREADEAGERGETVVLDRLCGRQQHRAGAVAHLRAVARGHAAAELAVAEHRTQLGQPLQAAVLARTFVGIDQLLAQLDGVAGQVGQVRQHLVRADLAGEFTGGDRGDGLLVRGQRERVLVGARDLPFLRDLLGGDAHAIGDGDVVVAEHRRRQRDLVAHHRHHRHRFGAAGEHQVGIAQADLVGGQGDRLQAGGAEPVDRLCSHRVRQAGQQHADARDVHALLALGHRAADDRVVDARQVDARRLRDHGLQHVGEHVVGTGVAEHALGRLAHRGAGGGDDVGVLDLLAHLQFLSGLPVFSMWAMRAWVFSCWASSTKCVRSSLSSHSSSTSEPRSTSPPHSTVAMRVAIS